MTTNDEENDVSTKLIISDDPTDPNTVTMSVVEQMEPESGLRVHRPAGTLAVTDAGPVDDRIRRETWLLERGMDPSIASLPNTVDRWIAEEEQNRDQS